VHSGARLDEASAAGVNGRSRGGGGSESVTEALEHLLDPLDSWFEQEFDSRFQPVREVVRGGHETGDGLTGAMVRFGQRLRWSRRLRYKIPRLVMPWIALGLAGVCLTWLMLRVMGAR
jgi:hypothetical protein